MRLITINLFVFLLSLLPFKMLHAQGYTQLKVPSIFGNHMVLQQNAKIPVWGYAPKGEKIDITLGNQKNSVITGNDNKWIVYFDTVQPSTNLKLRISSKTGNYEFSDILLGEVWLCSGQSNMAFTMKKLGTASELAAADNSGLRLFKVERAASNIPADDVTGEWTLCTSSTVTEFSATAYYFGKNLNKELKVPVGLIASSWGGTRIELWTPYETLNSNPLTKHLVTEFNSKKDAPKPRKGGLLPTQLYNAMIHPLVPITIKGFLWYQGEANAYEPTLYNTLFPLMITSWRNLWNNPDLPFIFAQLPNFIVIKNAGKWAELREAQLNTAMSLPNVGMSINIDIGDPNNIHPKNKADFGYRLALVALNKAYNKNVQYSGPIYKKMTIENNKAVLEFDYIYDGLKTRDTGTIKGFEICGTDNIYGPANAEIVNNKVSVWNDTVKNPLNIRYAWTDNPDCNLCNSAGLPAAPFRAIIK